MADRLKNIAGLFKEGRTRVILITTVTVLVIAVVGGIISARSRMVGGVGSATIQQAPGSIQSVPFDAPTKEYAELQEQQNVRQAKAAEQTGTSAIPTIVRAEKTQEVPPSTAYGVGFTGLSREQGDDDTFRAKSFGSNGAPQAQCSVPVGSPVCASQSLCETQGRIIGYVENGGKVRGLSGEFIGSIDPSGMVSDLSNKPIGKVCTNRGTPIYDKNGNLIGYLGPDGKLRDGSGRILGTMGPDGKVRDANGNIIGDAGNAPPGSPVYDKNGNLIGYVGADGKVRDANGNIIGSVDADGKVRDLSGKEIGQAGSVISGTPIYDENGRLIGYVGPDGKVRDASGRVIGTLGADGVVRDATGKVIGRVGTPVYDANGNLVGYAGPDGKVRNLNGDVIGSVGPDGIVRDANGRILGKAGAISPGTSVCSPLGKQLGIVGPDGRVRDPLGNVVGVIGVDGKVQDNQGIVVGSINCNATTAAPPVSAVPSASAAAPAAVATGDNTLLLQQSLAKDQQLQQAMQQTQQAMSQQANQLLVAWTSPVQQMVAGQQQEGAQAGDESAASGGGNGGKGGGASGAASGPIFIKAGTIYYGVVNTAINSDEPGPVMATLINGPYKGATILGGLTNQGQAVRLTFDTLSAQQFPSSIAINAVAIDQNTARTALSTYTDNHYLLRYGSLFAASFLQGYGQAFSQSGSSTSSNGLTTTQTSPDLSGAGKFYVALGNVGTQWSNQLSNVINTPATVYVAAGTAVGILFMTDVKMPTV